MANIILGFLAYQAVTETVAALVKEQLATKRTTTVESVRAWLKEKRLQAEVLASRADIRLAVFDLLDGSAGSKENLRSTLQAEVFGLGFSGFAAVKPDGTVLVGIDGDQDRRLSATLCITCAKHCCHLRPLSRRSPIHLVPVVHRGFFLLLVLIAKANQLQPWCCWLTLRKNFRAY